MADMKTVFRTCVGRHEDLERFFKDPKAAETLFFCLDDSTMYFMNEANKIIQIPSSQYVDQMPRENERPTNCKNCGAPLTSYKCEYCGTEY